MIRVLFPVLLVVLLFGAFAGCSQVPANGEDSGFETQVSDPRSGVVVRTHVDRDEISVSDRLWVWVEVQWGADARGAIVEPDWDLSEWTLVESKQETAVQIKDGFEQRTSYLIEPFLPGAYEIHSFAVDIYPASTDSEPYRIESMAQKIQVLSVLDAQDAGTLENDSAFIDPIAFEHPAEQSRGAWYILGAVALGGAMIVAWLMLRSTGRRIKNESLRDQLTSIANGQGIEELDAYSTLYRVFTGLGDGLEQTSEIKSMIEACERARFAGTEHDLPDPKALASHALGLLGAGDGGMR